MPLPDALPPKPAPLSFERRRWTVVFSLPFAFVVCLAGLSAPFLLPAMFGARLGLAMGIFFALMSLALAASVAGPALKALREQGPALVVDARGITDNFHLHVHLPWSAVQSATVDYGEGDSLMLTLRPGAQLPDGGVVQKSLWRRVRRAFNGGDVRIPLGGLVYEHRRLRDALKAHLAHQAGSASDKAR